jgi:replicative DNA helicase
VATEARLRPDADLGHMTDWGSKMAGATVRLAGLLHVAEHLDEAWRLPVSAATMRSAITVAAFFTDHALAAFGRMGADPAMTDARNLFDVIVKLDVADVSRREMMVATSRTGFATVADLDAPIAVLVDHGYLVPLPAPTVTGQGRRPSPRYRVVK